MTTQSEIKGWIDKAKEMGASHLLVVCDTFDWEDYPVEVMPSQELKEVARGYHGPNMQKVMECYDLSLDIASQLAEVRAFHGWQPA